MLRGYRGFARELARTGTWRALWLQLRTGTRHLHRQAFGREDVDPIARFFENYAADGFRMPDAEAASSASIVVVRVRWTSRRLCCSCLFSAVMDESADTLYVSLWHARRRLNRQPRAQLRTHGLRAPGEAAHHRRAFTPRVPAVN